MKIRKRVKIAAIHARADDVLHIIHRQEIEDPSGIIMATEKEVLKAEVGREMTLDEAVIFDVEKGDFKGATDGIGGAFLSTKEEP